MKRITTITAITLACFCLLSCTQNKKQMLFNEKNLDNWFILVSDPSVEAADLFWVEDGVITSSGVPHGYIRTLEKYSNFNLHVEWRWKDTPTNSGVLLHVQGEDKVWPKAMECQLASGKAGDIVLMREGTGITIRDSTYLIRPGDSPYYVVPKNEESSEKAPGEWNSYDITSQNGTLEAKVNGVLQNVGTDMTLHEGHILLQSEGSAIQFRNIWIEEL